MNLILLHSSSQLRAYYDSWNNWLFLDWYGSLTLPGVQQNCVELLRRCCDYPCQRVLNSNAHVHEMQASIVPWVGRELVPYLEQLGVDQLAWVRAALPLGQLLVQQALPQAPQLYLHAFDELELAVAWLQETQPSGCIPLHRLPAERARLEACVQALIARVSASAR